MNPDKIIIFAIIGLVIFLNITGVALTIAYLQKPPQTKKTALGYTALGFQVVMSIMLAVPFAFLLYLMMTSKNWSLVPKRQFSRDLIVWGAVSVFLLLCMIMGNILFYVSYFDETKKDDKQFNNLVTGFQSTMFLYLGATFMALTSIPCQFSSLPASTVC